jgi:glucokinase
MANPHPPSTTSAPSRPSHLRQSNARRLLRLLRKHNPCSKADLTRLSGLSAPTVSSAIVHLTSRGLIESIGDGESSGGRPPELLRFNATRGYVAGADIGGTRLRMMLTDLNGEVVQQWSTILTKQQKTAAAITGLLQEGLKIMCHSAGISLSKVLHLTAGAPGITNVAKGVVISAPNLKDWNDVPLRELLQNELRMPCTVENDTNLAAVGEFRRGAAQGIDNFVFIAIGTGVGAGIFLHGQLHHGAQWSAGEIGYLGVSGIKREPMNVRRTGQLERTIGGGGIEERWLQRLERCSTPSNSELSKLRAYQIIDLARDGHPLASQVVREIAVLLADAVADISLMLNPEVVILGGGIGSHPEMCRLIEKLLEVHQFAHPQVRSSSLGTQAQLFGAISLSLSAAENELLH